MVRVRVRVDVRVWVGWWGTVSGMEGVKVKVAGQEKTTDANGAARFQNLAPAAYSIVAEKAGYEDLTSQIPMYGLPELASVKLRGLAEVVKHQTIYSDILPLWAEKQGIIRGPAGRGQLVPVTRSDVADVAVRLVGDDSFDGQTINVSGPERVSLRHIANRLAAITGKAFEYQQESIEDAYASREHYGAEQWQLDAWVSTYTAIAEGELDVVTDAVEQLTGHAPEGFESFVTSHPECWAHVERNVA